MQITNNYSAVYPCQYSKESLKKKDWMNSNDDMQRLADSIKDKTGIVYSHLIPLQQLASDLNCIISFRPVDSLATDLIESGHPTKGFHIKGKSASWGPQAGFICVDQSFSKLENTSYERISKSNEHVKKCLSQGRAVSTDLTLTRSRIHSLLQKRIIDDLSVENSQAVSSFKAQGPSGKTYYFNAERVLGIYEDAYRILHKGDPIRVLAPAVNALAFTADYDLLIILPHISDYGFQDNLPVPDVSYHVFNNRVSSYTCDLAHDHALMQAYSNSARFYKNEDADIGNASARVRLLIDLINEKLVGDGEKVVHHNMDSSSPVTDLATNYPATFALPVKLGRFDKLCVIENNDDFAELISEAKESGYYNRLNPVWEKEIGKVYAPGHKVLRERLMQHLKQF